MITTKQGPLLQGEFRQRLLNGAYSIRAAGIYQLDKDAFAPRSRRHRARLSRLPRQRGKLRPVRAQRQMGLGLGWRGADRQDLPARLQPAPFELSHFTDPFGGGRQLGRLAALSLGQGRPQLFRRAQHLLFRLLDGRRAEPNPGHPSGHRLRLHGRSPGDRRRTRLQVQLHQPDARTERISTRSPRLRSP